MRNSSTFTLILATILTGLQSACHRSSTQVDGRALQIQLPADPVSLDPALAEDGASLKVLSNVLEGLVSYDGRGNIRNALAETYTVSPDGKIYQFKLRERASWSDGAPVKADQFVAGMRRSLSAGNGSKLAPLFDVIRGAQDFRMGRAQAETLAVKALDPRTLRIELEYPASYFLGLMTLMTATPFREDQLKYQKWDDLGPATGAFKIGHRRLDDVIVLEPNPYWWGSIGKMQLTYPPVVFRIVKEDSTAANLFATGKLDILTRVPTLDHPRLKAQGVLHTDPFYATYFLSFNTRKAPFSDRRARRAIAGAVHPTELIAALGTDDLPATSWIPPGLEGFSPYQERDALFASDMEWMKTHAAITPIQAGFDSGSRNSTILQKLQQDFKVRLGLEIQLSSLDWKTYVNTISVDPPSLFRFGWLAPFEDPIIFLMVFQSKNPNNYTGWSNAEYDRLVDQIKVLPSGEARLKKIQAAQKLLLEQEAVVVPIYHYQQTHGVGSNVKGFRVNPYGVIRFDELIKQPR